MRWIDPLSGAVIAKSKFCPGCKKEKGIDQFPWRTERDAPCSRCFECKNKYHRIRYTAKRDGAWTPKLRAFTQEELDTLRACIESGMTPDEAAAKLGRSRNSIVNARLEHGLPKFVKRRPSNCGRPRKKWTDDRLRPLARLLLNGLSRSQIGSRMGETKDAIIGATHRNRQRIAELQAHEARIAMGSR